MAFAADFVLNDRFQMTAPDAFSTEGTRLTSPGDNLVQF
jgi:hypothetical protein